MAPVFADFVLASYEDGILQVSVEPPAPIGGMNLQFVMTKRQGGTPIITKSVASGLNGQSGITVTNSGQGFFNVALFASETSGLDCGCYAYSVKRLDSGAATCVSEGYRLILP